jgi:hypothetical protein
MSSTTRRTKAVMTLDGKLLTERPDGTYALGAIGRA